MDEGKLFFIVSVMLDPILGTSKHSIHTCQITNDENIALNATV